MGLEKWRPDWFRKPAAYCHVVANEVVSLAGVPVLRVLAIGHALRQCGRDSEAVLGEIVSAEGLTLIDGRWCTEQEGRGRVFFADRSRGTRAAMAIGLVAKTLRATGVGQALVPVPQELWEGLDADNRAKLLQACLDLEVNIVTAECDRDATGALRAETFEG